jgi:tetratricopeptide (TPR) repeat protein
MAWKIVDFGIASQATSKRPMVTRYSRGTEGYRAPELIVDPYVFTNKVDIWATGCILFELLTGQMLFKSDFAIRDYFLSQTNPDIVVPDVLSVRLFHFNSMMDEMLSRDYSERPDAAQLNPIIEMYCVLLLHSIGLGPGNLPPSIPSYVTWKKLLTVSRNESEFLLRLAEWYTTAAHFHFSITLLTKLVIQTPGDKKFIERLDKVYDANGDLELAVSGWTALVEKYPFKGRLHDQLTNSCKKKGNWDVAIDVWRNIALKHPNNKRLAMTLGEVVANAAKERGYWEVAISELQRLVGEHPGVFRLRDELSMACKNYGDEDLAITVWKNLVDMHPSEGLDSELQLACQLQGDEDDAILVWRELVEKHPSLKHHLRRAFDEKGDEDEAIDTWSELVDKYPQDSFDSELKRACKHKGDRDVNIDVWKKLVSKHAHLIHHLRHALDEKGDENQTIAVWDEIVSTYSRMGPPPTVFMKEVVRARGFEVEMLPDFCHSLNPNHDEDLRHVFERLKKSVGLYAAEFSPCSDLQPGTTVRLREFLKRLGRRGGKLLDFERMISAPGQLSRLFIMHVVALLLFLKIFEPYAVGISPQLSRALTVIEKEGISLGLAFHINKPLME